jgi:hypothetical protein
LRQRGDMIGLAKVCLPRYKHSSECAILVDAHRHIYSCSANELGSSCLSMLALEELAACINDIGCQIGTKVYGENESELPGGDEFVRLRKEGGKSLFESLH